MADSLAPSVGRVFISYRREETAYAAGWLFDRLVDRFGRDQIFKDVDSIQLGDDFVEVINAAVGSCDVLIALIGSQWLTIADEQGRPRLADPTDFVRLEIEAALARNVRVIPVLVAGAQMPHADEMPPSLATLVRRNALELSPSRFDFDTSRLLRVLDRTVAGAHAQPTVKGPEPVVPSRQASLRALYVEARAEMRVGHFQTAIELLDDLLALDPSHRDGSQLRAEVSQQRHLAEAYQRATDAEAASDWGNAASAYAEILDVDATYRDAAARRAASESRQQVLDLQNELRHHATAKQWHAVLEVDAELGRLDEAAADPDGLASTAREQIARRMEAERATEQRQLQVEQLQQQIRERGAAQDWDAIIAIHEQLVTLDPTAADPDDLASTAREQVARRIEADVKDRPASGPAMPSKPRSSLARKRRLLIVTASISVAVTLAIVILIIVHGSPAGTVNYSALQAGNCLRGSDLHLNGNDPAPDRFHLVRCSSEHIGEVFYADDYWAGKASEYPGDNAITNQGDSKCTSEFSSYVGISPGQSSLAFTHFRPAAESWNSGDRRLICVAYNPRGTLSGTARGAQQ